MCCFLRCGILDRETDAGHFEERAGSERWRAQKTNKNKPNNLTKKPVALKHQGENRQNICGKASTGAFNI